MDIPQIRHLLNKIIALFQLSDSESSKLWVNILTQIDRKLSTEELIGEGLLMLIPYLGGMGSIGDVYFCETNDNIPQGYTPERANREIYDLLASLRDEMDASQISKKTNIHVQNKIWQEWLETLPKNSQSGNEDLEYVENKFKNYSLLRQRELFTAMLYIVLANGKSNRMALRLLIKSA